MWGDQLISEETSTTNQPQGNNANYVDLSNGFILFSVKTPSSEPLLILNYSNESFLYNINPNNSDRLPLRTCFHGGHKIRIINGLFHQELFVTPEFVLDFQSNFKRLNFGTYFVDGIFDLGFWYRHTRLQDPNNAGFAAQDAIILVLEFRKK